MNRRNFFKRSAAALSGIMLGVAIAIDSPMLAKVVNAAKRVFVVPKGRSMVLPGGIWDRVDVYGHIETGDAVATVGEMRVFMGSSVGYDTDKGAKIISTRLATPTHPSSIGAKFRYYGGVPGQTFEQYAALEGKL